MGMGSQVARWDELPDDEREIGWGDEPPPESEEDADLARLLAEVPPHHLER